MDSLFFLISFWNISCENQISKYNKLEKKNENLDQEIINIQKFIEKEEQKLAALYQCTSKERIEKLQSLQTNKLILIQGSYIDSILWKKRGDMQYQATVELKADKGKIKPDFMLYLYDAQGLIVGEYHRKPKFIFGKVTTKTKAETYVVSLHRICSPKYFSIVYQRTQ